MHATLPLLQDTDFPAITRELLTTLQINLGYRCNQSCLHCHVNAGPNRREMMSRATLDLVLQAATAPGITTLDLTGGAPELHPHFRELVREARRQGLHVIDRCNLTILEEPGQDDLARFLAEHRVEVIASLPCYLEDNVDRQRGDGVFNASIRALRALNALGYGRTGSELTLDLVFNPQGPTLPPPQASLEAAYREHLGQLGIVFTRLYTLANMPIARFGSTLISRRQFHPYLQLLRDHHQAANLAAVMCRTLTSIDWQGYVYDCDFNQMLALPLGARGGPVHLRELLPLNLTGQAIAVAAHCYGCTAGQGSSCGGALDKR